MSNPSSPTIPRRRLSSRRGSISAPDPYAVHGQINLNPNRLSSSTLTIVKVVPNATSEQTYNAFSNPNHTISLKDPPQRRSSTHRRIGSNETGAPGSGGSPRMSFAFSTFGPRPDQSDGRRTPSPGPPSPSSRHRPLSPSASRSSASGYYATSKPRLTPEQLYDLAHHATHPKHFAATSPPTQRGPHSSPLASSALSSSSGISTGTAPATFTPLHHSVYLPFIDRSSEVKALIESSPTRKLFALLKQTFPKNALILTNPDPSSPESPDFKLPPHPTAWSYPNLIAFLTGISRDQVPDALWVAKIRSCILSHSELIWERVKGALGVPPDLDVDFDSEMEFNADVFESSDSESEVEYDTVRSPGSVQTPKTEDMEDAGMRARGYWDGWDAIVDSPVQDRGNSFPPSAHSMSSVELTSPIPLNAAVAMLHARGTYSPATESDAGEITQSPTPVARSSDLELPEILQQLPTPTSSVSSEGERIRRVSIPDGEDKPRHAKSKSRSSFSYPSMVPDSITDTEIVIEPLILSPSLSVSSTIGSPGLNPPPLSLPASLADSSNALGNIMEGAEEEEEEEAEDQPKEDEVKPKDASEPTIDPALIHGLRISLPSLPSSPVMSNSSTTSSPVFLHRPLSQIQSQPHSRTNSLSQTAGNRLSWGSIGSGIGGSLSRSQSVSGGGGLKRTGSSGSITSVGSHGNSAYGYATSAGAGGGGGGGGGSGSGYESEGGGYDPVGDRAPGNPLFPSNFARLATGPTLVANNPSLRSPSLPPQSKYPHVLYGRKNKFIRRGSNTSGVSGEVSNDYALTIGSGSSVVGETMG